MVLDELPKRKANPTLWWAVIATAILLIILIFSIGKVLSDNVVWVGVICFIAGFIIQFIIFPRERRLYDIEDAVKFINEKEGKTYKVHDFMFDEIGNGNFALHLNKYGERITFRFKAQPDPESKKWMFTYVGKTNDNLDELRERFETMEVYKQEAKSMQDRNFSLEEKRRKELEQEDLDE